MIGVPEHVQAVKRRLETEMLHHAEVFGVGLTYDGDEWAVFVVRAPGLRAEDLPTDIDGVRVYSASASELAEREE